MNMLSEFLADKQFPKKLGRRIRGHFKSLFHEREDLFEHTGMFDFLHPMLQTSVRVSCNTHWPSAVEAIATLEPPLRARMFECIRPCNFERDELLYSPGEIATQIYFCVRGTVLISIQLPKVGRLRPPRFSAPRLLSPPPLLGALSPAGARRALAPFSQSCAMWRGAGVEGIGWQSSHTTRADSTVPLDARALDRRRLV